MQSNLTAIESRIRFGLDTIAALGVQVLTLRDANYPERLRHLEEHAPYVLFTRGRLDLIGRPTLAVVGSRRCSEYGADAARTLTSAAARAGAVIASGMALGIDGIAHECALDVGGDTIAVLGCGVNVCYPPRHRALYERIARDGLLVSEFAPGTSPFPRNFPHRNRIIAMLSHAVLVVEATISSGSLSTAARARDFMEILAVPGPMGRAGSAGCNALIRDGATIVLSPADVLHALELQPARANAVVDAAPDLSEEACQVWTVLSQDPMNVDEITLRSRLSAPAVTHLLLELELTGRVRQLPGSRFALAAQ